MFFFILALRTQHRCLMRPDSWDGHPVHSKKGRIVDNYDRFKEWPIVGLELLVHGPTLWGWLSTMLDVYATNRIIDEYVWTHTIGDTKARCHYSDVIMGPIASQITSLTIVYSIVYSDADQRTHQSSVLRAFVRGIHRGPVNSPYKWPVTRKMFPFDDGIMHCVLQVLTRSLLH